MKNNFLLYFNLAFNKKTDNVPTSVSVVPVCEPRATRQRAQVSNSTARSWCSDPNAQPDQESIRVLQRWHITEMIRSMLFISGWKSFWPFSVPDFTSAAQGLPSEQLGFAPNNSVASHPKIFDRCRALYTAKPSCPRRVFSYWDHPILCFVNRTYLSPCSLSFIPSPKVRAGRIWRKNTSRSEAEPHAW